LKIGIVGLPNVGKSTVFNVLSGGNAASSNYPFCTIEPNVGVMGVQDERLDRLSSLVKAKEKVPVSIKFVDIAGLVEGASKGEGLGNKFLSHIREVDAILQVVRCFEDAQVSHPYPQIDPVRDMEIVNLELKLADLELVEKQLAKIKKAADKAKQATLEKIKEGLDQGQSIKNIPLADLESETLKELQFLTSKPVVYLANIKEEENSKKYAQQVKGQAEKENSLVVELAAKLEEEIKELVPEEREEYRKELGIEDGLKKLINICYDTLNLITFYTIVKEKVTAWAIGKGIQAKEAAGRIHSDMEEGFIKAEVISFSELMKFSSYKEAKDAGAVQIEGKDYSVKDGDVIYFHFN